MNFQQIDIYPPMHLNVWIKSNKINTNNKEYGTEFLCVSKCPKSLISSLLQKKKKQQNLPNPGIKGQNPKWNV